VVIPSAYFGAGSLPIHLDNVKCTGTETSLIQCPHRTWGEHNCVHNSDVGISCSPGNHFLLKCFCNVPFIYQHTIL
jgi:hypothetical protein